MIDECIGAFQLLEGMCPPGLPPHKSMLMNVVMAETIMQTPCMFNVMELLYSLIILTSKNYWIYVIVIISSNILLNCKWLRFVSHVFEINEDTIQYNYYYCYCLWGT